MVSRHMVGHLRNRDGIDAFRQAQFFYLDMFGQKLVVLNAHKPAQDLLGGFFAIERESSD